VIRTRYVSPVIRVRYVSPVIRNDFNDLYDYGNRAFGLVDKGSGESPPVVWKGPELAVVLLSLRWLVSRRKGLVGKDAPPWGLHRLANDSKARRPCPSMLLGKIACSNRLPVSQTKLHSQVKGIACSTIGYECPRDLDKTTVKTDLVAVAIIFN
jgi:hypothetical protein